MSLEPGAATASLSPDSSGRTTPTPRQWRNQLSGDEPIKNDKAYRKYASGVERALSLFDTALQEWADYISFLSRLLKALQTRQPAVKTVPARTLVAKRLSQCLNPSLPSGVHQKAIEVYNYVFSIIGRDGLSKDLPLYFPGLASTLSFASLTVRAPFLELLETHFLGLDPRSLRPAMKSVILALLPGLEDETSEDFDRTLKLLQDFKTTIRAPDSQQLTSNHSTGDSFFWQCFFLSSITGQSRRSGALAYLIRYLPKLGSSLSADIIKNKTVSAQEAEEEGLTEELSKLVTSPEPGILLRCFAAGLGDDQLLIQRGFLDLLVSHVPLHSKVLQSRVKLEDLELLLRSAAGVVTRRDMSLNRRLWAWLLGPEPTGNEHDNGPESPMSPSESHFLSSKTSYLEQYGLQSLIQALLSMIKASCANNPTERARPYRICLSLMDRWEIGGLVVPEIFLPIIKSVRDFKNEAPSKAEFLDVLRSASVFFDGVESGLIFAEIIGLIAQAIGNNSMPHAERADKLAMVQFIMSHFNLKEEEMVTVHAPLVALSILAMLEEVKDFEGQAKNKTKSPNSGLSEQALDIALSLIELIPERAFPREIQDTDTAMGSAAGSILASMSNGELLKKIRTFYVDDQGNVEVASVPLSPHNFGKFLLEKACTLTRECISSKEHRQAFAIRSRVLAAILSKIPPDYPMDLEQLLLTMQTKLSVPHLPFVSFKSILSLATQMYDSERINESSLSTLVEPLVRHAWGFLSLSEPKFHVETVRCLWHLQTALSAANRDIEAAISTLVQRDDTRGMFAVRPAGPGRSFAVLWSHTLQDGADRRAPKTGLVDIKRLPRLCGQDHYEVMLTRPLFLILDSLIDHRTQLFLAVKSWLHSMAGIDKLLMMFVTKFSALPFLRTLGMMATTDMLKRSVAFSPEDDLDMCLYYIRTVSGVLRHAPDALWGVLASRRIEESQYNLAEITGTESDVSLQEFLIHVCLRCLAGNNFATDQEMQLRVAQLHRNALALLHQILLNPFADSLVKLQLEDILIERLAESLEGPDPHIQVLLLDAIYPSLRLHNVLHANPPPSATGDKRAVSLPSGPPRLQSTAADTPSEAFMAPPPPPPLLLNCIQAGLSSPKSRLVLDSWVSFLTECLPFFANSIFQVLIPLVETLCEHIGKTFENLKETFKVNGRIPPNSSAPESTLISLLNALEQVLAKAHDQLLAEEARAQVVKSPDQPQGFFGNMVSGVFNSETPQSRSATANDRLTVLLAFQDAVKICFQIWSWGQGNEASTIDTESASSFNFTSLRMRNRARRLLEHVFAAEALECLETVVEIWKTSLNNPDVIKHGEVFNLLPALDGSRPRHTIPAIFHAIYSRSNPTALDPSSRSTMTVSLQDTDIVIFLVDYTRSLEDDTMDEIWQDCMIFLKDLLGNPFPHRQTLPSLLEFAAILGEKVDNTNFGEQRKMRRELGDLFMRLLTALFTTRPLSFTETGTSQSGKAKRAEDKHATYTRTPAERADDVVGILSNIVPNLPKILVDVDRVLVAASSISTNIIGPTIRSKGFPETMAKTTLTLLHELTRLPNNQKTWKKDIGEAFNDTRFFGSSLSFVQSDWLPLLKQWTVADKERITEILSRITPPSTPGIVFGVGATSARLEADRKTQLNLRRIATLILASASDTFVIDLPSILDRLVELLAATSTTSPSSTTRAEIYMVMRALVLRMSAVHLSSLWPVVNAELHTALSSLAAPDSSTGGADTYGNAAVLQACKLLDILIVFAPDDFQLHEWLFVTDTVDAIYRPSADYRPVALADELSEELGNKAGAPAPGSALLQQSDNPFMLGQSGVGGPPRRQPLLGVPGGISDELVIDRRDELVAKILRPFFGQLSIFAFESTYAMGVPDEEVAAQTLLRDLFDERTVVKAL